MEEFLARFGDVIRLRRVEEVSEDGAAQLQEASVRLTELGQEMVNATPERADEILGEMTQLKALQMEVRDLPSVHRLIPVGDDRTFGEDWAAETDEERCQIIGQAIGRIVVTRGGRGCSYGRREARRLDIEWLPAGDLP